MGRCCFLQSILYNYLTNKESPQINDYAEPRAYYPLLPIVGNVVLPTYTLPATRSGIYSTRSGQSFYEPLDIFITRLAEDQVALVSTVGKLQLVRSFFERPDQEPRNNLESEETFSTRSNR